ncbi:MAG TPA: hypothetical protein VH189_05165 [Rhizomicrobium sp.]|nr:hypothetical protein [Rhizomicrobium sp.]
MIAQDKIILLWDNATAWGNGMDLNSNLPALVPMVIALIVVSLAAVLVLATNKQPEIQKIVHRVWMVASACIVAGAVIFWFSGAFIGTKRPTVDRGLQSQQQDELHRRLQSGGH